MPRSQAFSLRLEALHADKFLDLDFHRFAVGIDLAEGHADARIKLVGQQNEFRFGILADVVLMLLRGLHLEAFRVGVAVVVGIVEHRRPNLFRLVFLDAQDVVLEVVVRVESRHIKIAVRQHHQHLIVVGKFAEQPSVFVEIQSFHIGVEPNFPASERRMAVTLQADAMDGIAREQIALRTASLDGNVGERTLQENLFPRIFRQENRVERHLDDLRLAIRIRREIKHFRAGFALRGIHFAVARDARHIESLDEAGAVLSVAIDEVVGRARIVLLEHLQMQHVLAYKQLVGDAHHLEFSVAVEDDDVVDVGTVADELVLLQTRADEAFLTVDVEFLIGLNNLRGNNRVEIADFRATREVRAVFLLDMREPFDGDIGQVGEVVDDALDFLLDARHQFVGLVFVELQNALHLDFQEPQNVVAGHFANQVLFERLQSTIDVRHGDVERFRLLKFLVFIDAFLDENALQRGEKVLFFEFVLANFEFLAQQVFRRIDIVAQHVANRQELRFPTVDDAAVGRNADFAVREGVERVDGLVGRHAGREMHEDFDLGGGVVLDLLRLDFSLFDRLQNRLDERNRRF